MTKFAAKYRPALVTLFLSLVFVSSSMAVPVEPNVTNRDGFQRIQLGTDVLAAIRQSNPNFRMFRKSNFEQSLLENYPTVANQLPQAVQADFNGDGRQDVVVMGQGLNNEVIIMGVLSSPTGYQANSIFRWTEADIRGWADHQEVLGSARVRNWPYQLWLAPGGQLQFLNTEFNLGLDTNRPHIKYSSGNGGATETVFRIRNNQFVPIDTNLLGLRSSRRPPRGSRGQRPRSQEQEVGP